MREVEEPTITEIDEQWGDRYEHPAWVMIGASRVQSGGGAAMFDSDIKHRHYIQVTLSRASRRRNLKSDSLFGGKQIVQLRMSEAQWASFVSSMNVGNGVPCTLEFLAGEEIPEIPYDPRLRESLKEVRDAAEEAVQTVREAFEKVKERPNKGNIHHLECMIDNLPSNLEFTSKSMAEHTENVVQKARADIEGMVVAKAAQLGIDPGDIELPLLEGGEEK